MEKLIAHKIQRLLEKSIGLLTPADIQRSYSVYKFEDHEPDYQNLGLIFQGPMKNITPYILARYREYFPNATIILSTWNGENLRALDHLSDIVIIQSTKPEKSGILNFNYQLKSTQAGLRRAAELLPVHTLTLKLRTDYVPTEPTRLVKYVQWMENSGSKFLNRLWCVDINTYSNVRFSISDMLQVGTLTKLSSLWLGLNEHQTSMSISEYMEETNYQTDLVAINSIMLPERTIGLALAATNNLADTQGNYETLLSKKIGIIDADSVGFAFDKYGWRRDGRYPTNSVKKYINYIDWLTSCQ